MIFEVCDFAESPIADVASVGPAAVVDVHVGLQVAGGGKTLLTELTLVGLVLKGKESKSFTISATKKRDK